LWGEVAQNWSTKAVKVVAIKNIRVTNYNGKSLGVTDSTAWIVSPDIQQTQALTSWYNDLTPEQFSQITSITKQFSPGGGGTYVEKSLAEGRELGKESEKGFNFQMQGIITTIKHDDASPLYYTACPSDGPCKRKVTFNEEHKLWHCPACDKHFTTMIPRYVLFLKVSDHSGSHWMSAFDDVGKMLLGVPASVIYQCREENDEIQLQNIFAAASYKTYNMKIRAHEEFYQEEAKLKMAINNIEELNFVEESIKILNQLPM